MKEIVISLGIMALTTAPAFAGLLLTDSFAYPDGPIVGAIGSPWQSHSGTADTALVANQQLEVAESKTEDVNAPLPDAPYDTTNNPTVTALYSSFRATFLDLPNGSGSYLAHFKDNTTTGFRCRLYALTRDAAAGFFRLGIASTNSASTSEGFATYPLDLSIGETYTVITRLDLATGESTLWINPAAETDPSVASTANPGAPFSASAYAFRQANGVGVSRIDDLKIGTSFDDVAVTGIPPSISGIPDQTLAMGQSTGPILFTVGDDSTPPADLILNAASTDPVLVPEANIEFGGGDADRTVTVTPADGQQGVATITITVTDGDDASASMSFMVAVGLPTISAIPNHATPINTVAGSIAFTVNDAESDPDTFVLTAVSTNQALVPDGNIVFGGAGSDRTLIITPATDQAGLTEVTVIVSDGTSSASSKFVLTVNPLLGVLREDDFNRPDGPLVQFDGYWLSNGGTGTTHAQQMQIIDGRCRVTQNESEDVSTEMPPLQAVIPVYTTDSGTILYVGMKLGLEVFPSTSGSYFAHFRDGGLGFRCRLFSATRDAAPGMFRLGLANSSTTIGSSSLFPLDLATGVTHTVVMRYNVGTGESRLWVNPVNESSPSLDANDDPSPIEIEAFSFRQSGGIGEVFVDELKIGTAFADVVAPRLSLSIARIDGGMEISWPATVTDCVLQSTDDLQSAWSDYGDQGTVLGDRKVVTISGPAGSLFFRLTSP